MLIKNINNNTLDVFINNGWDNWARYKITREAQKKVLTQIAGETLPPNVVSYLKKKVGAV